jgi:hypothetical protein
VWTDQSGGAELQLEGAAIRLGEGSDLSLRALDERITHMQLSGGALRLRVRALEPDQSIEVDTSNLALVFRRTGDYRIEVDPQGGATIVVVHSGLAEVFGGGASFRVDNTQAYRFYGTSLSEYEGVSGDREDALDRWAQERERRLEQSASARFVPAGVVGYEDLDANGRWVVDSSYGNVWLPSRVDAGWTPYRDGRWTWIANAPWAYTVSHYGRWALIGNTWGWVPGASRERVRYAPVRDGSVNQPVRGAVVVPVNPTPRERAPDAEWHSLSPRDNHPVQPRNMAPATPPTAPMQVQAPVPVPGNPEAVRHGGAQADIARAEQDKHRMRDADERRGKLQRRDKEWTPEEELLLRGKRKQ